MIQFSSINADLQVKIAEKVEYKDQKHFELSSKEGKRIAALAKHEAVCDIGGIVLNSKGNCLEFGVGLTILSSIVDHADRLPPFKVHDVYIRQYCERSSSLKDLKLVRFVKSKVNLRVYINLKVDVFNKLTELFDIREFWSTDELHFRQYSSNPAFGKFCKLEKITMPIDKMPINILTKLMAPTMCLEKHSPFEIASAANTFFKQWWRKEREIKDIQIGREKTIYDCMKADTLFAGLPTTLLFTEEDIELTILKEDGIKRKHTLCVSECFHHFVIDRGDKKLLIDVRANWCHVSAQEVLEISTMGDLLLIPINAPSSLTGPHCYHHTATWTGNRRRVNFSSIAAILQVQIAGMMDYVTQKLFELSSKNGKRAVALTRHEAVCDIVYFEMGERGIRCHIRPGKFTFTWSRILRSNSLPRFRVRTLHITCDVSFADVNSLRNERVRFMDNEVRMDVPDWGKYSRHTSFWPNGSLTPFVFLEFAKIFNITEFRSLKKQLNPNPKYYHNRQVDLVHTRQFRGLKKIRMIIDEIPENILKKLTVPTMFLTESKNPTRISSVANNFFKQWFYKRMSIEELQLGTDGNIGFAVEVETLLAKLPAFSISTRRDVELTLVESEGRTTKYFLRAQDSAHCFLVNRGDKKLLIHVVDSQIIAKEAIKILTTDGLHLTPMETSSNLHHYLQSLMI